MKPFERISNPREIRRKLRLNQQEFWSRIGVTQSGGSRYESGRTMPKPVRELLRLVHIEGIAKNVNSMTTNVAAMTAVVSSTLGSPMIKAAAFTYGVRKTVSDRRHADAVKAARRKHRSSRRSED